VGRYHAQMFGTRLVEAWWEGLLLAGTLLAGIYVYWTVIFSVPRQERQWPAWVVGRAVLAALIGVFAIIRAVR
jgi:hypothetical protein